MAESERLDARVVAEGYATGRDKAKELIRAGAITVNGKTVNKPSAVVSVDAVVSCTADAPRYVGRGGLKLEAALQAISPLPQPCVAMDVGASTGGFTHCMLLGGVDRVYAIDVGHGQLHPTLLDDPRVVNLEGTDIRDKDALSAVIPPHSVDLLAMDVSFISICVKVRDSWYLSSRNLKQGRQTLVRTASCVIAVPTCGCCASCVNYFLHPAAPCKRLWRHPLRVARAEVKEI